LWFTLYGWNDFQHCDCETCIERRGDMKRCIKGDRCDACYRKDNEIMVWNDFR
jgi:hypothetical protein